MLLSQLDPEGAYTQRLSSLANGSSQPGHHDHDAEIRFAEMMGNKAQQFDDPVFELMLRALRDIDDQIITKMEATFPAGSGQHQKVRETSLDPLKAFVDSFTNTPELWLTHVSGGHQVYSDMVMALQKSLHLALANDKLRNTVLAELNQTIEVAIGEGEDKIVIARTTSKHTAAVLKPLSKRDLTDKLKKLMGFVQNHPEGFTIL